ncbi:MAG: hypothetical protein LBR22_08550 [Desulfovibrio sp.]|nr:hypothetical protein [Desulfovibrio sp.]
MSLAERLPGLRFEQSVYDRLEREIFGRPLANAIMRRLSILSEMATCATAGEFHELDEKYWHGDRAYFSDESDTRKQNLRQKLTFLVRGTPTLCSFHGKIKIRAFRIYIDSRPKIGNQVTIVYIGRKIL